MCRPSGHLHLLMGLWWFLAISYFPFIWMVLAIRSIQPLFKGSRIKSKEHIMKIASALHNNSHYTDLVCNCFLRMNTNKWKRTLPETHLLCICPNMIARVFQLSWEKFWKKLFCFHHWCGSPHLQREREYTPSQKMFLQTCFSKALVNFQSGPTTVSWDQPLQRRCTSTEFRAQK